MTRYVLATLVVWASLVGQPHLASATDVSSEDIRRVNDLLKKTAERLTTIENESRLLSKENARLKREVDELNRRLEAALPSQMTVPSGAVVAFANKCPDKGWSPYTKAEGRFILGVGKGPLESFVGLETPGGQQKITLTTEEMPKHKHDLTSSVVTAHEGGEYITINRGPPQLERRKYSDASPGRDIAEHAGNNKAHDNMPPYIALYFCRKD